MALYANIDRIEPTQAAALLTYVQGGGGFVPFIVATYCFRNNDEVVALMGGQFKRHGTGVFRTELVNTDHPVMKGFGGFESWDETYVHHLHNDKNRTILEYRVDDEGREPWDVGPHARWKAGFLRRGDTTSGLGEMLVFRI